MKHCVVALFLVICFFAPITLRAYSVLTHEAIIDACWDKAILPLLKKKYPAATADEIKEAHAYVYGGAVSPDMGYYPFGSKLFTNLIHYVRSGDFVEALLSEASDINEYAFAIGALCHYNADVYGHAIGINASVPIIYPKMEKRYGPVVTYGENKISHLRTEFGFDVLQTARGNYASVNYHDFIGFKVSQPVLEKAFLKTYGLDVHTVFHNVSLAIGTFRFTVKEFFPLLTRAAWHNKKNTILKDHPDYTSRKFIYTQRRVNYYHDYGKKESRPGFFAAVLGSVIRVLPKIGPLRALKFKIPNQEAENLFIKSFDTVVIAYTSSLNKLLNNDVWLANKDFDTGNRTVPGEYKLADKSYESLLLKLKDEHFDQVLPELKTNIISFYNSNSEPNKNLKRKDRIKIAHALQLLKNVSLNSAMLF